MKCPAIMSISAHGIKIAMPFDLSTQILQFALTADLHQKLQTCFDGRTLGVVRSGGQGTPPSADHR